MMATGTCRSCEAPITWATTVKGRKMPLDPEPVDDGNVWVTRVAEDGTPLVAVALNAESVPELVRVRYVSHFVTCPDRDDWRKPRAT